MADRWSDEKLAKAEKMWSDGATAAEIANTLGGTTRNAVMGMAHRRHWPARATKERKPVPPDKRRYVRKPPRPKERHYSLGFGARFQSPVPITPRPVEEPPKPPEARMVSLMDLKFDECRFPIGDPKKTGFGFCGAPKAYPYCPYHMGIAYQPVTSRSERNRLRDEARTVESA